MYALPLLYFSFFKAPIKVIFKINAIKKKNLWGVKDEERIIIWVKWGKVYSPKEYGDLNIKNMEIFNRALLAKWL